LANDRRPLAPPSELDPQKHFVGVLKAFGYFVVGPTASEIVGFDEAANLVDRNR
jgi:hypothetical protein